MLPTIEFATRLPTTSHPAVADSKVESLIAVERLALKLMSVPDAAVMVLALRVAIIITLLLFVVFGCC